MTSLEAPAMLDVSSAFTTFPVLHTERLLLRAPEPDDAAAMFPIMADPEVMRYFGAPPIPPLLLIARLEASGAALSRCPDTLGLIVERN